MAVRHSVDLVRPYRILKAIDKESSYYREEVEVVCVQWTISQIIHLKGSVPSFEKYFEKICNFARGLVIPSLDRTKKRKNWRSSGAEK